MSWSSLVDCNDKLSIGVVLDQLNLHILDQALVVQCQVLLQLCICLGLLHLLLLEGTCHCFSLNSLSHSLTSGIIDSNVLTDNSHLLKHI